MRIVEMTDEQKQDEIDRIKLHFGDIRNFMNNCEKDLTSTDLKFQANALWVSGHFILGYMEFRKNLETLGRSEKSVTDLQQEIMEAEDVSNTASNDAVH